MSIVGENEISMNQIDSAIDKLQNGKMLSERECVIMKEQIASLVTESVNTIQEPMKNADLEKLVDEFNSCARDSKATLEEMLSTISSGRVPNNADRKALNDTIDQLNLKYEQVVELARRTLQEDEMPEKNSTFDEYANAIINCKASVYHNQIEEIRTVLSKFISVQTLVENLANLLKPFQDEAAELLEKVSCSENANVDELKVQIEAPKLFVEAVECENIDSDEGERILDQIDDLGIYPAKITRGLSKKQFFISYPENESTHEKTEVVETTQETVASGNDVAEEKNDENETKVREDANLVSESELFESEEKDKTITANGNDMSNSPVIENESSFHRTLIERKLFTVDENFGLLSSDISQAESKKISASVFSNDIRKGNLKAIKTIIQVLDSASIVSTKLLTNRCGMPSDVAEASLEFMRSKGYLRKYRVIPGGEFYCESQRLTKSLMLKEACKLVGIRQHHAEGISEIIEDKVSSATTRLAYLKMMEQAAQVVRAREEERTTYTHTLLTDEFVALVCDPDNNERRDLFVGIFWTNVDECDGLLNTVKLAIEKAGSIKTFVICSVSAELCRGFADAIIDEGIAELESASVYMYVPIKEQYFKYDLSEIKCVDIWPELISDSDKSSTDEPQEEGEDLLIIDSLDEDEQDGELDSEKRSSTIEEQLSTDCGEDKASFTEVVQEDNVENYVCKFINMRKFYCATAYAKACELQDSSKSELYEQLAYAFNDPVKHCTYSADSVFDIVSATPSKLSDYYVISIGLRTFFSNQVRYDYNIKALYLAIKDLPVISDYPSLSNVMYKLVEFKDEHKKGLDAYADYHARSYAQLDEELKQVQRDAKIFYESTIVGKKSEKASQRRFLEMKKLMFEPNGDIGQYISAVVDNDKELQPLVSEFIQSNFIREGNVLSEETVDSDLLWDFVMKYWDLAGERMMMKLRADLMSHLRSNIISTTTKAIQILIRWCNLVEKLNTQNEDAGSIAYKKIRKPLLDDIEEAIGFVEKDIRDSGTKEEERAGLEVIRFTLDEMARCLRGTYDVCERKYFYVPFLLTDHVLLDETYCPDLDVHSAEIMDLQPTTRIISHAFSECVTPQKRIVEIQDGEDDYGSAKLLLEYVKHIAPEEDYSTVERNISTGEEYAKETAELRKEQFVGDLELAQSYGQIDNSDSREDKKEKILQIVDEWYEWAIESSNYGAFGRVMDSYLAEIKRAAKSRESDLKSQLDSFKGTSIKGLSTDAKEKKIAKIQAAIEQQNYTVAEDLLARVEQPDDDGNQVIEESFLKDFLDNYSDYYKSVAQCQTSLAMLVNSRTHNKEERGGKRLADNWLPGGSNLGMNRLIGFLSGLGFKVDEANITTQGPIGKFENYIVKTIPAQSGKRENYTHPIAAFGSGAAQDGFRVVCINGKYDAVNLIDVMKQIGNAKHTMILLDYALDKPERRILARKSKSELGDKLFVVIDRTVMMYMIKNYDETKVNRMLMSLITPFGYYQPYVWESSNVMPPEIFIGRKQELERIESSTGVNIVYGGRQLGKSALLKKAKADIDRDENGDRAILVDIKGLNYKEVAKKVGHTLFDEGLLREDISTNDWDELARCIKKRLQAEKDYIPYLLLLLDEADVFIESCKEVNYRPFDALKDIQSIGVGRFKFVIAGLRNVVRFQRDAALGNNSVLTHLAAMTVKPFKPIEARELMEVPLHYLGLSFPKENEALITLILATTNYFPGLIQMYCAKLLSAMRNKDYAGYDEADTPIYEISEEHIKKVLADPEFMEQIREKFFITLKLDEDNYYYLIALLMAYLYHSNGYNEGYSAQDIKHAGEELVIKKIADIDDVRMSAFMEELKELNVLRSTDESHYLFTRFTFFQMMGTRTEVDDKLEKYMEV